MLRKSLVEKTENKKQEIQFIFSLRNRSLHQLTVHLAKLLHTRNSVREDRDSSRLGAYSDLFTMKIVNPTFDFHGKSSWYFLSSAGISFQFSGHRPTGSEARRKDDLAQNGYRNQKHPFAQTQQRNADQHGGHGC